MADGGGNNNAAMFFGICAFGSAGAGAFCAFMSAANLVYYLFAGFFVGIWFQLGTIEFSGQILLPEALSLSIFLLNDISTLVLRWMGQGVAIPGDDV